MNIDKAVQAIRDTAEKEIKKLFAEQDKPWESDEDSYWISGTGKLIKGTTLLSGYHEMGNAFPTKEAAEKAIARRKAYVFIVREIARVNREEGWIGNWEDDDRKKFYVYTFNNKLISDWCYKNQAMPSEIYGCSNAIRNIMRNHPNIWKIAMGICDE